jgi:fido (protein-threonine AMPylation protein)
MRTCEQFAEKIRSNPTSQNSILRETRPFHRAMFRRVVPDHCAYLAGGYRGSSFECLRQRNVGMGSRRGANYGQVAQLMDQFHVDLAAMLDGLKVAVTSRSGAAVFAVGVAKVVANAVSRFQLIHPFADGNGHVARLMAWVILANHNMLPQHWRIHENPGWDVLVSQHQDGTTGPLEAFILRSLGSASPA